MYFLFDVGGTNIRMCLIEDLSKALDINQVTKIPTPQTFEEGMGIIKNYLEQNNAIGKLQKAIGGTTGVLDSTKSKLVNALNLQGWINKPLKEELNKITQTEIDLYNDSTLAALGEAAVGKGKDFNIVVYITISTGLGGSRIINKTIEKSTFNYEPGHQIINVDGEIKYLEDLVSGRGLLKKYGKKAEEITDPEIWKEIENYVAVGLNNILVHWSPDVVVIGGAVGKSLNVENIKSNLKKVMRIYPELPEILISDLRHNGIQGALFLLKQQS